MIAHDADRQSFLHAAYTVFRPACRCGFRAFTTIPEGWICQNCGEIEKPNLINSANVQNS